MVTRLERSVTSVSWIPRESIVGVMETAFKLGVAHYDAPPPDQLLNLDHMRDAGMFRFANELRGWIEVDNERVVGYGQVGRGYISNTQLKVGPAVTTFTGLEYPELRSQELVDDQTVRFVQTIGGRTGAPLPRTISALPYLTLVPPTVWTTLSLTMHADGRFEHELLGASPFPRHWIFDDTGKLCRKVAVADFHTWATTVFGDRTPWGGHELAALVIGVESPLERQLSARVLGGPHAPVVRRLKTGQELVRQGDVGTEIFLIMNGLLSVEVDGEAVGQIGPGAIVGERAVLGEGRRTASLTALTAVTVAVADASTFAVDALQQLRAQKDT